MEATENYVRLADLPALVERYHLALVRHAGRMVGADEAEDIVQLGWMRVLRALAGDTPVKEVSVGAWLHRIVERLALEALRWRPWYSLEALGWEPASASMEEAIERQDTLRRAILLLPRLERDYLLLDCAGYGQAEIGRQMGTSHEAVRIGVWRAKRRLIAWRAQEERAS